MLYVQKSEKIIMGKKRKATPISRGRSDSKEEKSPPGADDVMVARDRLKGALQILIDQSEDSSECSHDEASATAAADGYSKSQGHIHSPKKENIQAALGSALASMHNRGQRKRRRRGEVPVGDAAYHHTYVMKLYDRSVDLAQFREDTPLYPVCRAWMANQPRNTTLAINPSGEEGPERRGESVSAALANGNGEGKDMYKLPAPLPIPLGKTQKDLRIPSPVPYERQAGIDDLELFLNVQKGEYLKSENVTCPSTDLLLKKHLVHWNKVRRKWVKAAQDNEARYAESKVILQSMFKS
ncbi:hypothetical protein J437_LFUL014016 [Ladona fulva]|uniref:Uncharacterized protein n=1 Tax=Ladona fulva TaxID=123851 RepID=A0A8K0KEL1_LADFU|nr:hypothetical protein J437_LFUL014016 [Ladona fulva]